MCKFLTLREIAYVFVPFALFVLGSTFFLLATQRPIITVPNDPFEIGAGPYPETEIEETRITISVPERYVDLGIDFTRVYEMCYIYMLIPFNIESVSPVLYINGYPHQENFSRWGDFHIISRTAEVDCCCYSLQHLYYTFQLHLHDKLWTM